MAGTAIGVFGGGAIANTEDLGLDAIFPAFFLALLANELRNSLEPRSSSWSELLWRWLSHPSHPPGVPVLAACAGALLGLRWR